MKIVHIYGRNKNARCARCGNPFHYYEQVMASHGYNHRRKYSCGAATDDQILEALKQIPHRFRYWPDQNGIILIYFQERDLAQTWKPEEENMEKEE